MIFQTFGSFRFGFATRAVPLGVVTATFVAQSLPTLARITRSFDEWNIGADPFTPSLEVGMRLTIAGSASNNRAYTIASFSGDFDIFVEEDTVVAEGPVALGSIEGMFFNDTGFPTWPVQYMRVGDTAVPFADGIDELGLMGVPISTAPYDGGTVLMSPIGFLGDSVLNVDEYDWHLAQRTDDPAKKYFDVAQKANVGGQSFSGTCEVTPSALAQSKFGFTPGAGPIDPDITRTLFRGTQLYVRRVSDQAIQRLDMLPRMLGL